MSATQALLEDGVIARPTTLAGRRGVIVVGPLELGGAERQALMLARRLRSDWGMEIEVWGTMGAPGRLAELCDRDRIPWRIVPVPHFDPAKGARRQSRELRRLFRFGRALREGRFDVLLPFMTMPCMVTGLAFRISRARVCVWNQRAGDWDSEWPMLERLAARLSPVHVSNSRHAADYMARALGVDRDAINVVYNGVEVLPAVDSRETWRERIGADDDDCFVATMIANLHSRKNHAVAVRAWRTVVDELAADGRRAILVLAGRHDDTYEPLRALAAELGIAEHVLFPGQVADITGLVAATDLGILCSYDEGVPNAVLELLSGGVPVVGTNHPGIAEAVGPDGAGLLVDNEDHDALARNIVALARDRDARRALGATGRAYVAATFDTDRMVEQMAEIIAGAIGVKR
jgi:glycosyltransferase involved in cell wall biosynthesis